ncbi:MAG: CRTAC1 family protein [Thermoanaerobaculia bacterium]|nr:CRTAC1 family protein [Thermoanaerobaculia bacterium]
MTSTQENPDREEKPRPGEALGLEEVELVPEDDRIIGVVFRRSLWVLLGVLLVVGLVGLLNRREEVAGPEVAVETAPPIAVDVAPTAAPSVAFTDITTEAGLDFVHVNGAQGDKLLPETMAGGGGFFDLDGDGDQDIVLINGTSWPEASRPSADSTVVLYRNDGHGSYSRIADSPRDSYYGMGATAADYDGDGATDLFVTAVGHNHLYRNIDGRLVDVTQKAGVAGSEREWSTGSAFFDLEGDGDLDLYVANYVRWSKEIDFELGYQLTGVGRAYGPPLNYEGTYPYLYRNNGNGTFTDVSAAAGIDISNPATDLPVSKSLAVSPIDLDRDGRIDLFIANDTVRNFLFHNRGDGTFEEMGESWGLAYDRDGSATGAMGADFGFFRNDDDIGFLIGNFANEMTSVFVSQGDPTLFADEAITEGIGAATRTVLSFGIFLFDYDLDGRLDLLQNNGHLEEEIHSVDPSQTYRQAPQLFWNGGPRASRTFLPSGSELGSPIVGRGSAYADIDGDGDLDVLLLQTGGSPRLLRNDQQLGHHFVRLKLLGRAPNPDALGATAVLSAGGVTQRRQVATSRSYLSTVELPLTFGLGDNTEIESLVVTWPNGTVQPVERVEIDGLTVIEQNP